MTKWYITNSIPYLNAAPHIGHVLEFVQTDTLARWHRQKGEEVFYLSGTDEHGIKISRAAQAAEMPTQQFVDQISEQFQALQPALNLSYDAFIRTSDQKKHWPVAQALWERILTAGDVYKKTYTGLYCVGHEAFVTGKDLVRGECPVHKKKPEEVSEENWFFRLSKYQQQLEKIIGSDELKIIPETRKNEILSFILEGLEDVSVSRPRKDLDWGIPFPGDKTQTVYVWAEALIAYISGYGGIKQGEPNPADTQVIGKDILRFHATIWPAMLLSAKLPLPKQIFVHGFVTVNGEKISKSLGNTIDPFELVKKYGIDPERYYLLREIPAGEDGDFSEEKFKERYNGDLANGIGNLVARVATLAEKLGLNQHDSIEFNRSYFANYAEWFDDCKFDKLLYGIFSAIHKLDAQISSEELWAEKDRFVQKKKIVEYSVQILHIADMLKPFLPNAAEQIEKQFKLDNNILIIKKGQNLFPRL